MKNEKPERFQSVVCKECGGKYNYFGKSNHLRTRKHNLAIGNNLPLLKDNKPNKKYYFNIIRGKQIIKFD